MKAIILHTIGDENKELRIEFEEDGTVISIIDLVNWQQTKIITIAKVDHQDLLDCLALKKPA